MSTIHILLAVLLVVPFIAAEDCPAGQEAIGPCINKQCQGGTCLVAEDICCAEVTDNDTDNTNTTGSGTNGSGTNGSGTNGSGTNTGKAGNCRDFSPDCAAKADLCTDRVYKDFMARECPKTCKTCNLPNRGPQKKVPTIKPSLNCKDANLNCPTWVANGFCFSKFYTQTMKRRMCGSSCGLC